MAGPITLEQASALTESQQPTNYRVALIWLTSLFFMWGFLTALNDILIPYLKALFELNYTQAMLIQFCFFGAYFIVSLPAGALIARIGYQKGIVVGLMVASSGCLIFYPAAMLKLYPLFLAALFVLAAGITILQVSANPYVSVLGSPQQSSARLNLTQAFNSLGTTVAPIWIGPIILAALVSTADSNPSTASSVQIPYLLLAATLFILGVIFSFLKLPKIQYQQPASQTQASCWRERHLLFGAMGIFVYVGAEVGIGSFLVNFISMESITGMAEADAAQYIGYYFGGAMLGRFIGAAVMQKIAANKVLAFNAICASILLAVAMLTSGKVAMWAILLIGLCNSIMFPTIFTLAIAKLGPLTSQASGILCLAIVGGAILPLLQGMLADSIGIQLAFIIPMACYCFISFYGISGYRPSPKNQTQHNEDSQ